MDPIVYFFGSISGSFDASPVDWSADFFKAVIKKAKNPAQIILHRKDNLIYYCYVRQLNEKSAFGIGVCYDRFFTNLSELFNIFDKIYTEIVEEGAILQLDDRFRICWALKKFSSESVKLTEYSMRLYNLICPARGRKIGSSELPPANFAISINDWLEISLDQGNASIRNAMSNYCNIYIVKRNAEIERLASINRQLRIRDEEIRALKENISQMTADNQKLKLKQRNTIWIGILGIISVAMAVILYFKVINPSEVTHYETGEFVYYGPIKDKKPHGTGVAIYPEDDPQGRKYYIGNFDHGLRQDTAAILFYANGDYFYGNMTDDERKKGLQYRQSDGTYFKGSFRGKYPYEGEWFKHISLYKLVDGERVN